MRNQKDRIINLPRKTRLDYILMQEIQINHLNAHFHIAMMKKKKLR